MNAAADYSVDTALSAGDSSARMVGYIVGLFLGQGYDSNAKSEIRGSCMTFEITAIPANRA